MNKIYEIRMGRRGVIRLPKELRDQNNITEGEFLNLTQLSSDAFIVSRRQAQTDQIAKDWQDSGETLESMLTTLREVRAEYDEENSSHFP